MKSLGQKLETVHGLCGTKDVTEWEDEFIEQVRERCWNGQQYDTSRLTDKQINIIERIHTKHFA